MLRVILLTLVSSLTLAADCLMVPVDPGDQGNIDNGGASESWYQPGGDTTWQWQLQPDASGLTNTAYDVDVYDLDLFDTDASLIASLHADGRKVICYFSAGTYEDFRPDGGEFQTDELGDPLADWPDERWLDIRSPNVRQIMLNRLDLAASKGCDAVEPDNVDGFTNDNGLDPVLTAADQIDFNRFIAEAAHARGLGVGLKNDLDQVAALVGDFDFAVNEECHEFDECDRLLPFIDAGKPVFNAEYADEFVNSPSSRQELCDNALSMGLRTLVLPIDLDDDFRFSCDP